MLQVFKQKTIQKLKQEICEDLHKNRIMKFYRVWPKRLALLAHNTFTRVQEQHFLYTLYTLVVKVLAEASQFLQILINRPGVAEAVLQKPL